MNIIATHEELLKLHGKYVTCKLDGKLINDAQINVNKELERAFICQNHKSSDQSTDTLGYKYAHVISASFEKYQDNNEGFTEIQLID